MRSDHRTTAWAPQGPATAGAGRATAVAHPNNAQIK
jgi:hypothetical protein